MSQENSKHNLLCIVCPEGCEMELYEKDDELIFPEGICRKGQEYARQEIYNPCRVLTTTVRVHGGEVAMLPVRTLQPIPKAKLIKAMQQIANLEVKAPVKTSDVICQNIANTGVSLVACRTISSNQQQVTRNKE